MAKTGLIVHGGAGLWLDWDEEPVMAGVHEAAVIGQEILARGGMALDAVEKATNYLESHPLFDAGYGSHITQHGEVEMDALIVDGTAHNFGAVASIKHVRHPISLARRVMTDTPHCFFAGAGADDLALRLGFPFVPNIDFITERELNTYRERHAATFDGSVKGTGTVGAVALDMHGNIASATSTGGTPNKPAGRVGDSPVFGAGGYADSRFGGASATGVGENILRVLLSRYAVERLEQGLPAQEAAIAAAHYINAHFDESNAGIIMVDREGRIGAAHTTPRMPIGWVDENGEIRSSMGGGINGLE